LKTYIQKLFLWFKGTLYVYKIINIKSKKEIKMIAIPLDNKNSTKISKLYGNAPYFALLDVQTGNFSVVENEQVGSGPKIASFLKPLNVNSTIFFHMGEGVYNSFIDEKMNVYKSKSLNESIDNIYMDLKNKSITKLNSNNYKELLDPGTTGSCKCGCNN
jgi:predicted Fe-Mo cluster-binding NifX family protein